MSASLLQDPERQSRFVNFLLSLPLRRDRATLAQLRGSLGRELPGPAALRALAPFLPADNGARQQYELQTCVLLAGLFALHPLHCPTGNFGDAFRGAGTHDSAQRRFEALLNAGADDLPQRLRQAVSLLRAAEVPVCWHRLLHDLLNWEQEGGSVQFQWARAYWRDRPALKDLLPLTA